MAAILVDNQTNGPTSFPAPATIIRNLQPGQYEFAVPVVNQNGTVVETSDPCTFAITAASSVYKC